MDDIALEKLKRLIDEVAYAPSKKEGQMSVHRLEFMASGLGGKIDPYLSNKLDEVVSYAKTASGQVSNKEHWIAQLDTCWYVFESKIKTISKASKS